MNGTESPARVHIEHLREELEHTVLKHGNLLHPDVLRISQELDLLLVKTLREQLRSASISHPHTDNPENHRGHK